MTAESQEWVETTLANAPEPTREQIAITRRLLWKQAQIHEAARPESVQDTLRRP